MSIADVIRKRRKDLDLTLKDIANIVGVSEATVQRWESGVITNIRFGRLEKLANALQLSVLQLLSASNKPISHINFDIIKDASASKDLQDIGTEWMLVAKEAKESGLSAEQIMDIIKAIKKATNVNKK